MSSWSLADSDDELADHPAASSSGLGAARGVLGPLSLDQDAGCRAQSGSDELGADAAAEVPRRGRGRPPGSRLFEKLFRRPQQRSSDCTSAATSLQLALRDAAPQRGQSSAGEDVASGTLCTLPATAAVVSEDDDTRQAQLFLDSVTRTNTKSGVKLWSHNSLAENTNVHPTRVVDHLLRVACSVVSGKLQCLRSLHSVVSQLGRTGEMILQHFYSWRKYDETPQRIKVRWLREQEDEEEPAGKLMVVEWTWGMDLALPSAPERPLLIRGDLHRDLRAADSMEVQTVVKLIREVCKSELELSRGFLRADTLVTTDAHPSNIAAESFMLFDGPTSNRLLHLLCDVHKCSAVAKKPVALHSTIVSEMIQLALAFKATGSVAKMRRHLKDVVAEWVVHKSGYPPLDAAPFREAVCDTFLSSRSKKTVAVKTFLHRILNGDWRNFGVLEHYCRGCCRDKSDTIKVCQKYLALGFAKCRIKIFPRSNWCGSDTTVDQIGGYLAIHGLFREVFARTFACKPSCMPAMGPDRARCEGAPVAECRGEPLDVDEEDGVAVDDAAGVGAIVAMGGDADDAPHGAAVADPENERRKQLAQAKQIGMRLLSRPEALRDLFLIRRVLRPQVAMMRELLRRSGDTWELNEMKTFAEQGRRRYRILEAYRSADAKEFLRSIFAVFTEEWAHLPLKTKEGHCLAYRMLAMSGALTYKLFLKRHTFFPYVVFGLLDEAPLPGHSDFETYLDKVPDCMMDDWSMSFLHDFKGRLRSPEALRVLHNIATLVHTDTVSTERCHSWNRRRARSRVQTHTMTLSELAAWQAVSKRPVFHVPQPVHQEKRIAKTAICDGTQPTSTGRTLALRDLPPPKKERSLSRWQAFVSKAAQERSWKRDTNRLSEESMTLSVEYSTLSEEQLAELDRDARWLTMAKRQRVDGPRQVTTDSRRAAAALKDRQEQLALLSVAAGGGGVGEPLALVVRPSVEAAVNAEVQSALLLHPNQERFFTHVGSITMVLFLLGVRDLRLREVKKYSQLVQPSTSRSLGGWQAPCAPAPRTAVVSDPAQVLQSTTKVRARFAPRLGGKDCDFIADLLQVGERMRFSSFVFFVTCLASQLLPPKWFADSGGRHGKRIDECPSLNTCCWFRSLAPDFAQTYKPLTILLNKEGLDQRGFARVARHSLRP